MGPHRRLLGPAFALVCQLDNKICLAASEGVRVCRRLAWQLVWMYIVTPLPNAHWDAPPLKSCAIMFVWHLGSSYSWQGVAEASLEACVATSLFVQVPRDITEEQLRPLFEPYGDIEHINILRTHRGQSAGGLMTHK